MTFHELLFKIFQRNDHPKIYLFFKKIFLFHYSYDALYRAGGTLGGSTEKILSREPIKYGFQINIFWWPKGV